MKRFSLKLTWANLNSQPLPTILTILTLAAAVSLISILIQFSNHTSDRLARDLAGVELVVGAKGSPLQLILSSLLHVDIPTGNIPLSEAQTVMHDPLTQTAVPLALGDSFRGFRIVGTNRDFLDLYQTDIATGEFWTKSQQVVIGAEVSKQLGMDIGQQFVGAHGLSTSDQNAHTHDHAAYEVVGILEPHASIVDRLILTSIDSVWHAHDEEVMHGNDPAQEDGHDHEGHDHESHEHESHDHEGHDHEGHDHESHEHESHDHEGHDHESHEHEDHDHEDHGHEGHDHATDDGPLADLRTMDPKGKEITALLVKYTSPIGAARMPRAINDRPGLQAAAPAIEINRLFNLSSGLMDAGKLLAVIMTAIGGLSIFVAFSNAAVHKIYDIALLRAMGAKPGDVFFQQILEGIIVSTISALIGIGLAHLILIGAASIYDPLAVFGLNGGTFYNQEVYLCFGTVLVGIIAAIWPAINSYRIDPMLLLKERR